MNKLGFYENEVKNKQIVLLPSKLKNLILLVTQHVCEFYKSSCSVPKDIFR